jgi:hypothetical protein
MENDGLYFGFVFSGEGVLAALDAVGKRGVQYV